MSVGRDEILEVFRSSVPETVSEISDFDRPLLECGIDSLDLANFLLGVEEKYTISISEEDYEKLKSMGDVVDYVNKSLSKEN